MTDFLTCLSAKWEKDKNRVVSLGRLDDAYELGFVAAWHARALPKLQKVDLDAKKCTEYEDRNEQSIANRSYNAAIDDIKSKYGELYAIERN